MQEAERDNPIADYRTPEDEHSPASSRMAKTALIPSAVAFNIALAYIMFATKAPVYLDCVGIITTTLIAGLVPGLSVCVLAFPIMAMTFNPMIIYFTGTAAMMAISAHLLAKIGGFKTIPRAIASGIMMGFVSAFVSMPVSVKLFGAVTTAGSSLVTAFFLHRGLSVNHAALVSGILCDALSDKWIEALIAVSLIRAVPKELLRRFNGPTLGKNFHVKEVADAPPSAARG
jgi:energy-coupling factor transport system substrate-specific component